jgi:hypothetical protein
MHIDTAPGLHGPSLKKYVHVRVISTEELVGDHQDVTILCRQDRVSRQRLILSRLSELAATFLRSLPAMEHGFLPLGFWAPCFSC